MKKLIVHSLFVFLCVIPVACHKLFPTDPLPVPPLMPTPTATSTPTLVSTPGCGFTVVTIPTPVTVPTAPGTFLYAIRNQTDWQNYYGSASAPAFPATLGSQMILINLQSIPVSQYILPYLPYIGVCGGVTYIWESDMNYPTPAASFNYTVAVQNVCWTPSQVTVSYDEYIFLSPCTYPIIRPITTVTPLPTPFATPTPEPTPTPAPSGTDCNPGVGDTIYIYDAVGVVVPLSSGPVTWDQVGTLRNPGFVYPCPAN
jgi:hypothetical protein